MKRKIIILILTVIMLVSSIPCVSSAASGGNAAAPCWQNTGVVSCKIEFLNDGYGYAAAHVMGHPGANKIHGDVYVYRKVGSALWVLVGEEHKTVESCSLTICCKFTPIKGEYYRANYTFVVTKNGVDETITHTRYKTC